MNSLESERRYRVLVIASHPVQYQAPLLRRMAVHPQLDLEVAYCSLRGAEPGLDREFGVTVQWDIPLLEGYSWKLVPNRGSGEDSFWGLNNPGLWRMIREGKFDAVFCHTGYIRASFWIALLASKLSGSVFIFGTDANRLDSMTGPKWKQHVKRVFWPLLYRLADQAFAPSAQTRDMLHSLGIPLNRITVVPFCVDNDWWSEQSSLADREAVRNSWGASATTGVVLMSAKLQPWKRPLDLLRAFARADFQDALLIFVGDGPLRAQLQQEAAALGVADRVRFLGFVNQTQLPAIYTSADVMVLPSGYEGFGVIVTEAMLCGRPMILTDIVGCIQDLIAPVAPEFVYRPGDVDALTKLLQRALSDPSRLAAISDAARLRMKTWSPRENIAAIISAVESAVARQDGRASGR
ncbi:MAG TPA: glycosyltransferase family 4 protein [Candidatus Dormibacteraeota bacterium]|nr:glycosyltransferase family 4 protein [Candidatus Dormibacteraeota bacterium]